MEKQMNKYLRTVNIPVVFFCIFSILLIFSYKLSYVAGIVACTILLLRTEKYKYDKYKCADEIKNELLASLEEEINAKYVNLNNKISEIHTNLSKVSMSNRITGRNK